MKSNSILIVFLAIVLMCSTNINQVDANLIKKMADVSKAVKSKIKVTPRKVPLEGIKDEFALKKQTVISATTIS